MTEAPNEEDNGGSTEPTPRSDAATRLAARRAAKAAAKASKRGTAPVVPGSVTKQVQAARSFYEDNARLLLGGIGAGLLVAILWITISSQLGKSAGEASAQLYAGIQAQNGVVLGAGEEPAEDALVESFPSAKARAEKARDEFETTAKKFADSAAAQWALLGKAHAVRELGKNAEAIKAYEQLIADQDTDAFVHARALEGLGFALEAEQKPADALKHYEKLATLEKNAYKPLGDYHRARMFMALGQKQKAADVLEALVKAERARPPTEGTRFETVVSDAETLLTELSVELDAPKLRAEIPGSGSGSGQMPMQPGGSGGGLTPDIIDALRKQLASGKGGGVTPEVLDALEKQVKSGESSATTVKVPAAQEQSAPAEPK